MNAAVEFDPATIDRSGLRQPRVAIIGSGMSGMLTAIRLREAGITDFTIYEKGDRVGGTWRDNTYPGLACDVPAHMYTYSFEPNPDYSHRYARGPEIQKYFERIPARYDLLPHIRFNAEVKTARYDDHGHWLVETADGETATYDFLFAATGVLHHPSHPDIPGLETFAGAKFHTARWDHSVDLNGKRVGIIGTGSTAVQIFPELVDVASRVSLFQRTPQWVFPLPDRPFAEGEKERLRGRPWLAKLIRDFWSLVFELTFARAVIGNPLLLKFVARMCRWNLDTHVRDPDLRRALTPTYQAACKRLIFSSNFYPAFDKPAANLVTTGIERIEAGGVRTNDGQLHELDVLVLATGFKAHNFWRPMALTGKGGITVEQAWANGAHTYRSVTMPDFPNFFMLIGPNSPIGNYSLITIAEIQVDYILQLVRLWQTDQCDIVEAKREPTRQFNAALKAAMKGTVWVTGCQSWYLDQNGDPAMWPWTFGRFRREMRAPELTAFRLERRSGRTAAADEQRRPLAA